jgi:zinc transport system ATP-binding protein
LQTINSVIEVSNLSFSYEEENVLEDINFVIEDKDFLSIIGPNGGGKSTLLKLLLGIYPLQKGHISIFNEHYLQHRQTIGYVPQNTNININFPISVLEIVMMGQNSFKKRLFGYKKDEYHQAYEALGKVDMSDFASHRISNLSGGQRQRVFIARALFSNPKILLLDEPTSHIDVHGSEQVYKILKDLNKYITIVVVSHDISVTLQYSKRVFYVNKELVDHNLEDFNFAMDKDHICEVELLQKIGACRC